jgi:tungstate transport system ATP-binding protein
MEYLYQIRDLRHYYNANPVLNIDALSIRPNTITGIIGPNGSGKSTLLKLLAFIDKPSQGELLFKGIPAEPFSENVRFRTTLLTQEPYLMKRSVYKNISYGLGLRSDTRDIRGRVYDALSLVGLPADQFAHRKWYELSGGEAQRVALACRLVLKPEVLLLDEPTASIDASSAQVIKDTALMARREWGTTLIIASHDLEWLYDICEGVMHLFKGRLFGSGRENFIFGPWSARNNSVWEKPLQDGQLFQVSRPISDDAVAVIDPEDICLKLETSRQESPMLRGIVTRLALERNTQNINIDVQVGSQTLTASLPPNTVQDLKLHPGLKVILTYDIGNVQWYAF